MSISLSSLTRRLRHTPTTPASQVKLCPSRTLSWGQLTSTVSSQREERVSGTVITRSFQTRKTNKKIFQDQIKIHSQDCKKSNIAQQMSEICWMCFFFFFGEYFRMGYTDNWHHFLCPSSSLWPLLIYAEIIKNQLASWDQWEKFV